MGTDCIGHLEVKIDGKWHHYRPIMLMQSYEAFGKLGGVRHRPKDGKVIAECRGIPEDATFMTRFSYEEHGGGDAFAPSWAGLEEIAAFIDWRVEVGLCRVYDDKEDFGRLFGQALNDWLKYPEDGEQIKKWVEDVRFVFWFE